MKLQHDEAAQFAEGLASGDLSVDHLLEAFDYDEEVVQQIIELAKTVTVRPVERFDLL